MATTTSVTTTFAGERDQEIKYISAALFGGETLGLGLFTIKDKIKKKRVMKTLQLSGTIIKARTTLFTATGTLTIGERSLTPKYLEVNIQLTKSDFEEDWDSVQMGDSAHKNLPKDLQEAFVLELAAVVAQDLEIKLWQGDNGTDEIEGIMVRAKADASIPAAQKITQAVTIDASTIIGELAKIVAQIPKALRAKNDLVMVVDYNMKYSYVDALGGFGASGLGANGISAQGTQWYQEGNQLSYSGVRIVGVPGMTDDSALVFEKSKLWFGTDLLGDYSEIVILDQSLVTGDDVVNCIMKFSGDTNYAVSADLVYYGATA